MSICSPALRAVALVLPILMPACLFAAGAAAVPSLQPDSAGNLALRWGGVSGRFYRIERSTDLVHWTTVPGEYFGVGAPHAPVVRPAGGTPDYLGFWRVVEADRSFFTLSYPSFPAVTVGAPLAALPATVTFPDSRYPVTYAVVGGALPAGLSLDPATGAITGVPTSLAPYRVQIRATNGTLSALATLSGVPNVISQPNIDQYRSPAPTAQYYVDSVNGLDANDGSSPSKAWKTLAKINALTLQPGNVVNLARGSLWNQQLTLKNSGTATAPIVVQAYGTGAAPTIQRNTADNDSSSGVRISGSYINLLDVKITEVHWSAIHLEKWTQYVVVAGVEVYHCGAGIDLIGKHHKAMANYIHDMTMVVDTGDPWTAWGANGVGFRGEDIEIAWNRFVNCRDHCQNFGGYDGGVVEYYGYDTDGDGWNVVSDDIRVHHNFADACDGFMEANGRVTRLVIAHNVFVNIPTNVFVFQVATHDGFRSSYDVRIENNTLLGGNTVFSFFGNTKAYATENKAVIRNNLVACCSNVGCGIAPLGDLFVHDHNLFWFLPARIAGPGIPATVGGNFELAAADDIWVPDATEASTKTDPGFVNYEANDVRLLPTSRAVNAGASTAPIHGTDPLGTPVPSRGGVDIGAYECP